MTLSQPDAISESAFQQIRALFARESGIRLPRSKRGLVANRLQCRVRRLRLADFDAYAALLANETAGEERAVMVDLLTTHETYFFRERQHFDHLAGTVVPALRGQTLRVWCAAASTGEEAWSAAMTLASASTDTKWEILATDISARSLEVAERGLYRMERLHNMPAGMLKQHCLRGKGEFEGSLLINPALRERLQFRSHNLLDSATSFGKFDVVFLRNVLIYFEQDMRQRIVERALEVLKPGGWLYTGHADTVMDLSLSLETVGPALHRKPLAGVVSTRRSPRLPQHANGIGQHAAAV